MQKTWRINIRNSLVLKELDPGSELRFKVAWLDYCRRVRLLNCLYR